MTRPSHPWPLEQARPDRVGGGLAVSGLEVRFGGLVAVTGLDLEAPFGRITGLIGPNGAGKSTTFNACCGLVQPSAGTITFAGTDLTGRSPAARARLGLGRTFQRMQLFGSLSVELNVALGREASFADRSPLRHALSRRAERDEVREATADVIRRCGLEDIAGQPVHTLSTGQRRLVELARAMAGPFSLLLMDEPSSGLDTDETERLAGIVRTAVAERGVGILLVEHDMSLVQTLCETVHVLDYGRMIYVGPPEGLAGDEQVRAAYLGTAELR